MRPTCRNGSSLRALAIRYSYTLNETVVRTRSTQGIRMSNEHFVHYYTAPAMFTDVVARFYDLQRTHTARGLQALHGIDPKLPRVTLRMEYDLRKYVLQGSTGTHLGGVEAPAAVTTLDVRSATLSARVCASRRLRGRGREPGTNQHQAHAQPVEA